MDPVIVVGAGPVGLTAALALTRRGVPVVLLDEGGGQDDARPARTTVLRPDTAALVDRLAPGLAEAGCRWSAWRTVRRRQTLRRVEFDEAPSHLPQHVLTGRLRAALAAAGGDVRVVHGGRLDLLEQDDRGVTVHTRGRNGSWWRGSYLIGCDGARSTVRKLLGVRFPGRTAVERYAVAALRAELPWPGEAVLHRSPPRGGEVTARPLPGSAWRLDWLLPPRGELVTPDALIERIRDSLTVWCGQVPPYELLDTGVHTVHHRLARRWRVGRAFLAGDAAHLLGALGTQGVDEGLRDVDNLTWKLALAWHQGASEALLDSYQSERRAAIGARLRAADQALPPLRGEGAWPAVRRSLPGAARGHDALLTDGHLGLGPLGAPPVYGRSSLTPPPSTGAAVVATEPGAPVADVPVTAPDGTAARLRDRLGGDVLVVLIAPGTAVWDRRHWLRAGLMPRLSAAVGALPVRAELLVAEAYPGAAAHTVLLVRPDGHLAAAWSGVRPAELYAGADTVRGGAALPPGAERSAGGGQSAAAGQSAGAAQSAAAGPADEPSDAGTAEDGKAGTDRDARAARGRTGPGSEGEAPGAGQEAGRATAGRGIGRQAAGRSGRESARR
ncbi:FAD-dependent monooxygenase [Streptomyces sp. URMC 123]|uniref:FAD-dependent monooxygenase n=1 Tax=Streptomyces sp. URMC 123 TaxID=3423403 RepID=UPI003F1C2D74